MPFGSRIVTWLACCAWVVATPSDTEQAVAPLTITGRVLVADGVPERVQVLVLTSQATRDHLAEHTGEPSPATAAGDHSPDIWQTTAGPEGHFALELPHLFAEGGRVPEVGPVVLLLRGEGLVPHVDVQYLHAQRMPHPDHLDLADVALSPEGRLAGRVLAADGHPQADVEVECRVDRRRSWALDQLRAALGGTPLPWRRARTDAQGRFVLLGLETPRGEQPTLDVRHPAHRLSTITAPSVMAGVECDLGDIRLDAGRRAAGRVTTADGRPLAGATVVAGPAPPRRIGQYYVYPDDDTALIGYQQSLLRPARAVTDENGHFVLTGMEPDDEVLYAAAEGFDPVRVRLSAADDIVLEEHARLWIAVRDAGTGEPVARAKLAAQRPAALDLPFYTAPLDVRSEDGGFVVGCAGRAATDLWATAAGYGPVVEQVDGLGPGETRSVTLLLPRAAGLRGQLLDEQGAAVTGRSVTVSHGAHWFGRRVSSEQTVRTDGEGRWSLGGLPPGEVLLRIGDTGGYRRLTLAAGEVRDVHIPQGQAAPLHVEVRRPDGTPAPDVEVEARVPGKVSARGRSVTDAHGRAYLSVPDGPYDVVVETAIVQRCEVRSADTTSLVLTLESAPTLDLRVFWRGVPTSRTLVLRNLQEPEAFRPVSSPKVLRLPTAGRWSATRFGNPPEVLATWTFQAGERRVATLELPEGRVTGRLVDADGRPQTGSAEVLGPGSSGYWRNERRTDDQGRFTCEELVPGPSRLRVTGAFRTQELEILVPDDGSTAHVEVVVAPAATLELRVTGLPDPGGPEIGHDKGHVRATLTPGPGGQSTHSYDTRDGTLKVQGLDPGEYALELTWSRPRGHHPSHTERPIASTRFTVHGTETVSLVFEANLP